MNSRFKFTIHSPRWKGNDTYHLDVNDDGWIIHHMAIGGNCDKRGKPYLYSNLDQDWIQYPSGLCFEIELLYEHARDKSLLDNEIQRRLDELGNWVNRVNAVERPSFDEE